MKKSSLVGSAILFAFFLGASAIAQSPLYSLEGQTPNQKPCALVVLQTGFDGGVETPDRFFAEVTTTDSHGGQGHLPLRVKMLAGKAGTLFGKSPDGKDQIAIQLDPPLPLDLKNAKSFNLKWLHGSHYHTLQCGQLRPRAN